jgi:hypothetical protein
MLADGFTFLVFPARFRVAESGRRAPSGFFTLPGARCPKCRQRQHFAYTMLLASTWLQGSTKKVGFKRNVATVNNRRVQWSQEK